METIATDLSKTWTSSSLSWNMVFGSCSNVSLTYLRSIFHYLRQLTSHYPKYLLLWSAIMNRGPSSISQYFVFEALLSAHPLSSVKIGEICSGQVVVVSACVPRSLTQLSPPQKLHIARRGPCCQCQADSMLPSAVKCCQVLSELEQGGESPI